MSELGAWLDKWALSLGQFLVQERQTYRVVMIMSMPSLFVANKWPVFI